MVMFKAIISNMLLISNRLAAILPLVIKFLDQFRHALDVIVSCARKTEVALWEHLFSVVGKPKDLFEVYGKITPCAFLT